VTARPGAASDWGLRAVQDALSHKPDLLFVEFAINDASLWRGLSLARSEANHRKIIAAARAAGTHPVLVTMSVALGRKALERPGLAAYHHLYRRLADETGAGLIDLAPAWLALTPAEAAAALPDDLHPTAEAVGRIAVPRYVQALRPVFCDDKGLSR
jgi:lysophospholipase L1-like esterase